MEVMEVVSFKLTAPRRNSQLTSKGILGPANSDSNGYIHKENRIAVTHKATHLSEFFFTYLLLMLFNDFLKTLYTWQ